MTNNYEVIDLLLKQGRSIVNNTTVDIPVTHLDSLYGLWIVVRGTGVSSGGSDPSVTVEQSVDGESGWSAIESATTLTGTVNTEIEIAPTSGSTLQPFMRLKFSIPANCSLVLNTLKRSKRL